MVGPWSFAVTLAKRETWILLSKESPTVDDLASAIGLLSKLQDKDGGEFNYYEQRTVVMSGAFTEQPAESELKKFEQILSRLAHAPDKIVTGIGKVPAINVPITVLHLRSKARQ